MTDKSDMREAQSRESAPKKAWQTPACHEAKLPEFTQGWRQWLEHGLTHPFAAS